MRTLRLIRPWQLQTRRQKTGYDRLEDKCSTPEVVSCRGPQDYYFELAAMNDPRTRGPVAGWTNAAPVSFLNKERGPGN